MYRPRLRYYFCVMRQTSMRSQISLIRYLNLLNIVPYLNWDGNWEKEISSAVKKSGVKYKILSIHCIQENKMKLANIFSKVCKGITCNPLCVFIVATS